MLTESHMARLTLAGYRPSTLKARRACLAQFERHIAPTPLADATRHHVESFLARRLAPESRRSYRSHLRSFYRWCLDEGLITVDPMVRVPAIRVPRAVPRPVTDEELTAALIRADARMRAWLLLMALAGLRCIEVAGLRPADLITSEEGIQMLYLRECKGGGTATMPAHAAIVGALAQVPIRGDQWWCVSRGAVSKQVGAHLRDSGVNATAHRLRHYAGTAWYRASGHDVLATARLLRHASIQTTQVYAELDPTRPAEVVALVRSPRSA